LQRAHISHKLDELRTLCHKATVMRNGCVAGTADPARETAAGLDRLMVGGELPYLATIVGLVLISRDPGTIRLNALPPWECRIIRLPEQPENPP